MLKVTLDRIDHHILDLLQTDNRIANAKLAAAVGLSPPACSRRVARLHKAGIIVKDVAIVDPAMAGKDVRVIVAVTLATRRKERIESFQIKIRQRAEVMQCYMVAGAVDFFVVAALGDVAAYADFASEVFAGDHNVSSYESWFVLGRTARDEARHHGPAGCDPRGHNG